MRGGSQSRATWVRMVRKVALLSVFLAALSACNASNGTVGASDQVNGGPGANLPPGGPGGSFPVAIGSSCVSSGDPNHICLGMKYVVYQDANGNPVATAADALSNLKVINQIWAQCDLSFQIEEFDSVNPVSLGLAYSPSDSSELDPIRSAFQENNRFLMVTTGTWNRSGTLGQTSANAWTSMPGSGPYGSVLEAAVATYPYIYAHELGHYLNLDHVSDTSDLMNPVIYTTSTTLTTSQCDTARSTALNFWSQMTRH